MLTQGWQDHFARKLGDNRRTRRPIDAGRDTDCGQHDRHVERLGGPRQEADIQFHKIGARFRANRLEYLILIVDQYQVQSS
jgi:hypothetical protein